MARRGFYCPDLDDQRLILDREQSDHARRVLRLGLGDRVRLFNGAGRVGTGRIVEAGKRVRVEVIERAERPRPRPWIDLAVAVPKGRRADGLIEKASELGADRLIPLQARRSVVEPGPGKQKRFERIALASAGQCERAWLLRIDPPTDLDHLLRGADHDRKLLADTHEERKSGPESADSEEGAPAHRVIVLIGPEGGWSDQERRDAVDSGFKPWRLGPHVLRVETAAAAAVAILRYHR